MTRYEWESVVRGFEGLPFFGAQYDTVRLECELAADTSQGGGWVVEDVENEGVMFIREDGDYVSHKDC